MSDASVSPADPERIYATIETPPEDSSGGIFRSDDAGKTWQRTSGDEQRQFVELFTELLERSYLDQIEAYDGEKIVYGRESLNQDQADVETKILTKKGEEFSLNYKLRSAAGDWKIYDVVIENVSLVNNFRSQFNRILANASMAELIKRLQSKALDVKAVRG